MAETVYSYSISSDFPAGKVNTSKLAAEIGVSAIVTALSRVDTVGDAISIVFKGLLSASDKTLLDGDTSHPAGGLIAAHDNTPSPTGVTPVQFANGDGVTRPILFDALGLPMIVQIKPAGLKATTVSQNWCDPCSWYQGSTQITEVLTGDPDGKTFSSPSGKTNWIDMKHGRVFCEDTILKLSAGKYVVSVTAGGSVVEENSPGQTDKDFTVDYANGKVVFNNTSHSGQTVQAQYWYASDSTYTVAPDPGCMLTLQRVEIQFSKSIILRDTANFNVFGWVDAFAPAMMQPPYNLPSKTLIPLGEPMRYKTVADYVGESNGAYPITPAFGGDDEGGWRKQADDIITLAWDYATRTVLEASKGMCLKVWNDRHRPHQGSLASVTFYCIASSEPES